MKGVLELTRPLALTRQDQRWEATRHAFAGQPSLSPRSLTTYQVYGSRYDISVRM